MSAYVLDDGRRVVPAFLLNSESGGGLVTPPASFRLADGRTATAIVLVDENGDIAPNPLAAPDYWETFDSRDTVAAGTLGTANRLFLTMVDEISATTTTMTHHTGLAAGNCRHAIYTFDGTTFTLVGSTPSTALAGSNTTQDINLSVAYTRQYGVKHYAGFIVDATAVAGSATVSRLNTAGAANGKGLKSLFYDVGSFTLPATIAVGSVAGVNTTVWQHGE
jgi:hypothetical protein